LIILAGIAIATITGENGIVNKSIKATNETRKKEYEEGLKLIQIDLKMDKKINNWTTTELIDEYNKRIEKDNLFDGSTIVKKDDETIEVTTKEGDVFIVEEEKIEYKGTKGENVPPSLKESDIEIDVEPEKWTNTDVTVRIKTKIEGYNLQYSLDGTTWENYDDKGIIIAENRAIYARLMNNLGETGGVATGNIQNIDRELPTISIGTNGGTYKILAGNNSVEVMTTLTAEDTGGSGVEILQYQFSNAETIPEDNDSGWKTFENGETITDNIVGGTNYLYTKVIDKAGNKAIEGQKSNAYIANYQIKYDANGGTGAPEEQTKTHGSNIRLSTTNPTKGNFTFAGWSTTPSGSVSHQSGGEYTEEKAVTLYAIWEGNNYTISLNNQSASSAGTTAIYGKYANGIYLDAGRTKLMTSSANGITVPTKAYTVTYNCNGGSGATSARANATFGGYYTGANGAGTQMIANNGRITASLTNTTYSGNATLYAKWTPGAVTLPSATRANYIFNGWYTAASGGSKIGNAGVAYTPSANTTIYAQWRGNPTISNAGNVEIVIATPCNGCTLEAKSAAGNGTLSYEFFYRYELSSMDAYSAWISKKSTTNKVSVQWGDNYYEGVSVQAYCKITCNVRRSNNH